MQRIETFVKCYEDTGLPWWLSRLIVHLQCMRDRRHGFDFWVGKIPWRRKWQPTPVLLLGKIPWAEEPRGDSPWGFKELDTAELLSDDEMRLENEGHFLLVNHCSLSDIISFSK